MISAPRLSALLASLHSAPLEEENWQVFFDGLCKETKAVHGLFFAVGAEPGLPHILAQGGPAYTDEGQRLYNDYYGSIDPYWGALMQRPRLGPVLANELVPRRDADRSEFYNDLAAPYKLYDAIAIPAAILPTGLEAISIWRGSDQKPFEPSDLEFLELLFPHIQAALNTRRALLQLDARAARADAVLDVAPGAVFILDSRGKVVQRNLAAESLLSLRDGLSTRQDRLVAGHAPTHAQLQALITSAVGAGSATLSHPGGAIAVPRPSGKRPFYAAVFPLRLPVMTGPAHVLVLVTDPEASASFPGEILKTLFGLTHAEAGIANALLAGNSIEEIADMRHVTSGTLRIQMKAILSKTNTRRQSGLIRLLQSLPREFKK